MRITDFALERYFARWEFAVRHVLCASDVESVALDELLALADDNALARWSGLRLGYTESLGLVALREEIAQLHDGASVDDVITVAGAEEGVFLSMHALLEPGDHAVVVTPAYQSLYEVARSIGADVTLVPLQSSDWSLDVDTVIEAMGARTRVVTVNFPHSPTGAQLARADFERLAAAVAARGAHLFSDEVYRLLEHDPASRLPTGASLSDRAVSLGVMSKAFGLAGLRIGWIVTRDARLRGRIAALKDYTTICNSAPSEVLALIGLRAREQLVARSLGIIRANLDVVRDFAGRHSRWFEWVPPRAGSVCFPRLRNTDADTLADRLAHEEGVLILPGSQFDYSPRHFRLGLGRRDLPEGLARVEAFIATNPTLV